MTDETTEIIRCPACGSFAWYIYDTYDVEGDDYAARLDLKCDDCGHHWDVYREVVVDDASSDEAQS